MRRPHITATALGIAGALVLVLAGCSAPETPSSTAASGGGSASCLDDAKAIVDTGKEPVALQVPDAPLDLGLTKGDVVAYVPLLINGFTSAVGDGLTAAADAAGATVTTYDPQGSPSSAGTGIEQAVAQGVKGIVVLSVAPALIENALATAGAAGIPVVNITGSVLSAPVADNTVATITADYATHGEWEAAWAAANSNCAANVAIVTSSLLDLFSESTSSFQAKLDELCAETCTSTVLDVDLANAGTDIPNQVTTALQRDPSITEVSASWDGAIPLVIPAVTAAGSNAAVMGHDGVREALDNMVNGDGLSFTIAYQPAPWLGWAAFDDIARANQGLPLNDYTLGGRIIDSTNIGDGSDDVISPEYVGFEDKFVAAWSGK